MHTYEFLIVLKVGITLSHMCLYVYIEDELDELLDDLIFDIDSRPRKAAITQTRAAKIKDDKGGKCTSALIVIQ